MLSVSAAINAVFSFVGGLAKSLVLPLFAWLAGKRRAENRQKERVLDNVEEAKKTRDELDKLNATELRERGKRWVRGAGDEGSSE